MTDQVNQQRWNDTVEKLRLRFNLSDREVVTIKEWGIALLITGVSVWILYRIMRTILGFSSKKTVVKVPPREKRRSRRARRAERAEAQAEEEAAKAKQEEAKQTARDASRDRSTSARSSRRFTNAYSSSPWFPLIKRYAGPLLIALAKRQIARYLRANHIIR